MEIVLILALIIAVAALWGRVRLLEQRVSAAERAGACQAAALTDPLPEPPERPAHAATPSSALWSSAPAVSLRRAVPLADDAAEPGGEPGPAPEPEPEPEPELDARQGGHAFEPSWSDTLDAPDAAADDTPPAAPTPVRAPVDLEDLFGRVLPIWAGGLTLAVAGFFVVRFSIEAGLLTPTVRVALGFLFGLALLGGAEAAYRAEHRVADPRVRQALAGAGIATLYASFYLAGTLYGLIGPALAFAGLAAVTAAAVALSHRFGVPTAVLGLIGGFAAPLLVPSDGANVPLLATYLALLTGGLMGSARARRWSWLGIAALAGGLAWGVVLLLSGAGSPADLVAAGAFIVLTGALLPALLPPLEGRWRQGVEMAAAAVAALQMGALVMQNGFSLLGWGLLALLGTAFAVLGWRNPPLRQVSAFGAGLLPFLLLDWDSPALPALAGVTAVAAAIFAGVPLALVWRRRHAIQDTGQLLAAALGLFAAFAVQVSAVTADPDPLIAAAGLLLAVFPALACWRLWPAKGELARVSVLAFAGVAAVLVFAGIAVLMPYWALTLLAAALAGGWLWLARGRGDEGMMTLAWAGALACVTLLLGFAGAYEIARLAGAEEAGAAGYALRSAGRWLGPGALLAWLAATEHRPPPARLAQGAAALLLYGAGAQLLPADALAWFAAAGAIAALLPRPALSGAAVTAGAVALLWAAEPLAGWLLHAIISLTGEPMLAGDVPAMRDLALRVLPLLAVMLMALWRRALPVERIKPLAASGAAVAVILAHSLFKRVFAIPDLASFARTGLLERTVWEALLIGLAALAWFMRDRAAWLRPLAVGVGGVAGMHWLIYTGLLHNPLWSAQAVGALPVLNLLLPAYAIAVAVLLAARGWPGADHRLRPALDGAVMVAIALFAFSTLRQFFSGTFLMTAPVMQGESLLQSLVGIVLAGGFLWWGAQRQLRSWRIGSLVAALGAVGKVFLLDAAALDGFARIASFAALGFSLIGIGWFYARQLRADVSAS